MGSEGGGGGIRVMGRKWHVMRGKAKGGWKEKGMGKKTGEDGGGGRNRKKERERRRNIGWRKETRGEGVKGETEKRKREGGKRKKEKEKGGKGCRGRRKRFCAGDANTNALQALNPRGIPIWPLRFY